MSADAKFFFALIWLYSLAGAFFYGHEFGMVEGARIERQNQGYKFETTPMAFTEAR